MSHPTGICGSSDLRKTFDDGKSGALRLIKVAVKNEQLVADSTATPVGTWQEDYDRLVLPCILPDEPCYLFFRIDSRLASGLFEWIFITYTPDTATVRKKMVYAAARQTLKNEFGVARIRDELFGTVEAEVNFEGLMQHVRDLQAPKPLTEAERELQAIKLNEDIMRKEAVRQPVKNVAFPLTQKAVKKLQDFRAGKCNFVELSLNTSQELIELESADNVRVDKLRTRISRDHARYNFYSHQHSTVFIYSMPEGDFPIKERMLYSTCKGPLLEYAEKQIGLTIAKKFETDNLDEFTEEFLSDQLKQKRSSSGVGKKTSESKNPFSW